MDTEISAVLLHDITNDDQTKKPFSVHVIWHLKQFSSVSINIILVHSATPYLITLYMYLEIGWSVLSFADTLWTNGI
jgi:hypothetical protein